LKSTIQSPIDSAKNCHTRRRCGVHNETGLMVFDIDHVLRRSKQSEFRLFNIDQVLRRSRLNGLKPIFYSRLILFAAAKNYLPSALLLI
jgi:hypothetical protein